ncbi:MAG: enolase, partial [Deltaproteobacteria bacterium]|nr:enolase [Deltaproteobacteria bacterium]
MSTIFIKKLQAREIINGRGIPAVEAELLTNDGRRFTASAPSGVSASSHEAIEIRDGGRRIMGKGVLKAVNNIVTVIGPGLKGMEVLDQKGIDRRLLEMDGTPQKSRLGGNAITAVSLVVAKAGAAASGLPVYRYLAGAGACSLPIVCPNMISGSRTAGNELDFEDYILVPHGFGSLRESLFAAVEVFHTLHRNLQDRFGLIPQITALAPPLKTTEEALDAICQAVGQAGYDGKVGIGIDVAANNFYDEAKDVYHLRRGKMSRQDLIAHYLELTQAYPIRFLEDGLHEDDFEGFAQMTQALPCMVLGDDLFATNQERLAYGGKNFSLNAALFKVNQAGTVSEFLEAAVIARRYNYKIIGSVRSGETEDPVQADLGVAIGADYFKVGAPIRGEMTVKYNQFLRIEEELNKAKPISGTELS